MVIQGMAVLGLTVVYLYVCCVCGRKLFELYIYTCIYIYILCVCVCVVEAYCI
jgi:hypothetical protein